MHIIEFGSNQISAILPAASMHPHSVSVMVNQETKCVAALIDSKTISVHDLIKQEDVDVIEHSKRIDWLVRLNRRTDGGIDCI